jgi:hypothetical protein
MRVSVVVPLFNKAEYIMRTLQSIVEQSFEDFEAIIVDDGSTDGGAELAEAYSDSRFRVVRQANGGPGAARNRGVAEARGELIAFLDADDAWMPGYLATSVEALDASGRETAAISSGYIVQPGCKSAEGMWRKRGLVEGLHRVVPTTPCRQLAHMVAYMTMSTTVVRSESILRWGGFYSKGGCRYGEDAALWLKVLLNEAVYVMLEPLVSLDYGASQLGSNFRGPRPVEPFLIDPEDVERVCPRELLPLLRRFYARCAAKTAVVVGAWGNTAMSRELVRRHVRPGNVDARLFVLALMGCTPMAGAIGRLFRPIIAAGQRRRGFFWKRAAQESIERPAAASKAAAGR